MAFDFRKTATAVKKKTGRIDSYNNIVLVW